MTTENIDENDIVYRLEKRAEIRRQIATRKSVQEGKPDRIADLLEESANWIKLYREQLMIERANYLSLSEQYEEALEILNGEEW